jgi:hypothetical protein
MTTMTNYEKIRAMSAEEMAAVLIDEWEELFSSICAPEYCDKWYECCNPFNRHRHCCLAAVKWLNSEVEE